MVNVRVQRVICSNELLDQPVLFSKRVKASTVETLLVPEQTSNATIAATVVPTT